MFEGYEKTRVIAQVKNDNREVALAKREIKNADEVLPEVNSPDLFFTRFILVSEKENLNGDYFSREELINAVSSPVFKPMNVQHEIKEYSSFLENPVYNSNINTIIGCISSGVLVDKDGNVLTKKDIEKMDKEDNPNRIKKDCIDIACGAVFYQFVFPKTVTELRRLVDEDEIFVSMEVYFKKYDFMVGGQIVKTTSDNKAELLAMWKGGKKIDGRRVSRVLRNIVFGACAVTSNPANPESEFATASLEENLDGLLKAHDKIHAMYDQNPSEALEIEHSRVSLKIRELGTKMGVNYEK